jgi:hypothetical protein
MRVVARKWTRTWVGPGGRALASYAKLGPSDTVLVTGEGVTLASD